MGRFATANEIINRAAGETGISPVTDPFSDTNEVFSQLRILLDSCGQELVELHEWQHLVKEHQITTSSADSGRYTLPSDFSRMIDQTHWDRTNDLAVAGPLSAQDWTYLLGRDLVSSTIYASFRQNQGEFWIFPQPPPDGLDINFEYMSRNWVNDSANPGMTRDNLGAGADEVLFEPILIIKFLIVKFRNAKGLDSSAANVEFNTMMQQRKHHDVGAKLLNAGDAYKRGYPYLQSWRNTPDTNFGM